MPYSEKQLQQHRDAMARGVAVPVTLENHEKKRVPGTVRLLRLSDEERGASARNWLLIFVGLAPLSVICPPHVLWPFVMLTVGIVGWLVRRRRSELVLGGEAHCPKCGAFQILEAGNAEFPLAHFCSECRARSLVMPDAVAAAPQPAAETSTATSAASP